ncbi:hypothetical protein TVAG_131960 [Trichomonas vaginalis G3]|uniref:Uncharacterized protein n=1 Tax=Trichomonas vaginalis (strain ATCC PRA-98 / G3) TaxID=412133 RepID=A2FMH5_TRIV3|nr:hypothetical protein TVAGG3_0395990 [Trichomonas vaginalis G3]EAX93908.1 hypothetical protein TVAG_131960 [Trichomonas vaginalis G3]KAI5534339.1 hypothetical protein TVAGG3_0395990 [Trichomonas vaginalis G3]|eukprot:XP_001306838.1 hypothetical protein [Trichomonas vaginalis G3]
MNLIDEKKKYIKRVANDQTPFPTYKRREGVTTTYLYTLVETKTESMVLIQTFMNYSYVTIVEGGGEKTVYATTETVELSKTESYTIINTTVAFETYKKWDVLKISLLVVGDLILIGLIALAIICLIRHRRKLRTREVVDIGDVPSESDDIPQDFKVKIDTETHIILYESQEQNFPYKTDTDNEEE